ncbi:MAG: hypothetical protein GW772_08390 [Flavobacteriia bacterium]|nr:hypothetical protein [Flavobacteriia bacterium]OIP46345.1 MAG: hypothetical protein AUK46_09000 [Flavobacteriaceae bacterium CG2_30_31_66]PIV95711.1 MAG: hypothetical protein COW43_12195 [Flavobacteriaceae bacterium CG17_big_fil_post_rev_8_21_14_2_50_31_13]PIY15610.1 MAG: hypothetical protein COZ16_03620 [Flavobacteriaceae bacterium CG_4_10_14_3_um_filter_31_253]PIZ09281.1 MAG: hypothetical protein COY55_13785 [Flavobacteriaceae bacterium CG_4_10_14_0_8_um_filter_31_99]PJC09249.1 MAG: hypot
MKPIRNIERTRAQESTNAIEKLYITMRHLFTRGFYKPMGISGETLRKSLLLLRPEIYGSIGEDRVELNGLVYVIERLPEGIEECQFINLTTDEGYKNSHFKAIIPPKRRRNCYRIDKDQMNIEITRGRSEIYDILTHLTFLFIESHKIFGRIVINEGEEYVREWDYLEDVVLHQKPISEKEKEVLIVHLGNILGRTFDEVSEVYTTFSTAQNPHKFFNLIYWLGKLAINEILGSKKRTIIFSSVLIEEIGHHIYGEVWADRIKQTLRDAQLLERPIHIISANMHSVLNSMYAKNALPDEAENNQGFELFRLLSNADSKPLQNKVKDFATENGLISIDDTSGTNIDVQIIDTDKINFDVSSFQKINSLNENPVIIVMDYAFGEQAFETMDELLKPYKEGENKIHLDVKSISIMGKAGILEGGKGDIMIPSSHIFEGTADNYPFKNELSKEDLEGFGVKVYDGAMITVLGTSLQNRDLLKFFHESTWNVIGLEMEGAHYQKAIQSASKIRGNISENVKVRYAYYASDNPIETGATLASGGLGMTGVVPTYAITQKILEQIL